MLARQFANLNSYNFKGCFNNIVPNKEKKIMNKIVWVKPFITLKKIETFKVLSCRLN